MISFCIPAYTYVEYTSEAVRSLLAQDEDFEVIVVDDFHLLSGNSAKREALEGLRDLLRSDPRIRSVSNVEKLPIQQNWNRTVGFASREHVKLMGADDRIAPGGVRRILQMLRDEPSASLHGHLAIVIGPDGEEIRRQRPYHWAKGPVCLNGLQALKLKLAQSARFKEPVCNVYKKAAWERVGGYSTRYRFCFDIAFNVALMSEGSSCLWNEYVVELRRHGRSDGAMLPPELALDELQTLIDEICQRIGPSLTAADLQRGQGWLMYRLVELAVARFRREPRKLLSFIIGNQGRLEYAPGTLAVFASMITRRLIHRDVQLTIDKSA